jgi:deoxyribonuclease-4
MKQSPPLLLGAHCSAAGGVHNALLEGQSIGATCIQLFTANQRRWVNKPISDAEIALWKKTQAETGISHVMSHDGYLINLGAPDPENLRKSREAFKEEIERCIALNCRYLNFHPGAALDQPREQCAERIIESLRSMSPLLENHQGLTLLIETTAGQGSTYGCTFEEIGILVDGVKDLLPIGVCVDTCHIFAAGYDIRTAADWDRTLGEFEKAIGLRYLQAMHLNDSVKGCGSRVDRHLPLGKGEIGLESFQFVMRDPRLQRLPKYLETPEGPPLWTQEIDMLRGFAHAR